MKMHPTPILNSSIAISCCLSCLVCPINPFHLVIYPCQNLDTSHWTIYYPDRKLQINVQEFFILRQHFFNKNCSFTLNACLNSSYTPDAAANNSADCRLRREHLWERFSDPHLFRH